MAVGFVQGGVGVSSRRGAAALCARRTGFAGQMVLADREQSVMVQSTRAKFVMITSNDFRPGMTIELDGSVHKVVEFLHVKPGKGAAFVRTKLKNLETGNTVERTFRAGETAQQAMLDRSTMQHTYIDGNEYVFMNMESYEEERLPAAVLGDQAKYMKEGLDVDVLRYNGKVLDVELPKTMVFIISQTDPGVKGNTVQGGTKSATLETGAVIQVPLFIKQGERVKVDTRENKYISRAKDDEL
eukprot:Plantae.Rhodophyta-Purpureofilum_apyrenoidigerum.ctg8233.p1 GENE.Plantae.Rhodophyta-Purpureofilum_apyrenoidigerum.ctg8233~~Plantae.Rhodophyta-Purpureofilum_apyrenoidigerum.ctg8233.p1  ORF type:complete len:242 (-),score=50.92 Plantae.Rhodophyta-Purpureofilum_apyrenoidigerum.ctg8233:331-1056(-)